MQLFESLQARENKKSLSEHYHKSSDLKSKQKFI